LDLMSEDRNRFAARAAFGGQRPASAATPAADGSVTVTVTRADIEAARARQVEWDRMAAIISGTPPSDGRVVATAAAIERAAQIARGELQVFTAPVQQPRRTLTAEEQASTAQAIIAAGKKVRGEK
jgi:hypothetical protein